MLRTSVLLCATVFLLVCVASCSAQNKTFMQPWPSSFWAAVTVTKPDQGLWGVPGQVFYDGVNGLQRTDYNVRCAFGGDPTQPCTLQMSNAENAIFLLTGLNRDNCCILFKGIGAPSQTWTSRNMMFYNGTTFAFGQAVDIYWDAAPDGAAHIFFVIAGTMTPVLLQPENWLFQTGYVEQQISPDLFKLPQSCSTATCCPGFSPCLVL